MTPSGSSLLPESAVCRCPRCGSTDLNKRSKRNHIDRLSHNPKSIIQYLLGGQLYHCVFCRLEFYDLRPLQHEPLLEGQLLANGQPSPAAFNGPLVRDQLAPEPLVNLKQPLEQDDLPPRVSTELSLGKAPSEPTPAAVANSGSRIVKLTEPEPVPVARFHPEGEDMMVRTYATEQMNATAQQLVKWLQNWAAAENTAVVNAYNLAVSTGRGPADPPMLWLVNGQAIQAALVAEETNQNFDWSTIMTKVPYVPVLRPEPARQLVPEPDGAAPGMFIMDGDSDTIPVGFRSNVNGHSYIKIRARSSLAPALWQMTS